VVTTPLQLAFVTSAGFFDAGFLFDSMGSPLLAVFSLALSECFEGIRSRVFACRKMYACLAGQIKAG
jgi:hypothetical protein